MTQQFDTTDAGATPLLSIVTVNRNMRDGLDRTLRSVRAHSGAAIEQVVVDGASTDGSRDLLEAQPLDVTPDAPVALSWVSEPDRGIYDAMNKGARMARGRWLLFLNAGDILAGPRALAPVLAAAAGTDADIVYGDAAVAYPDGSVATRRAGRAEDIARAMPFAHAAALIRRPLMIARPYALDGQAADYAFFLSHHRDGGRFRHVPGVIAVVEAGGLSDRRRVRSTLERWRAVRRTGGGSPLLHLHYAYEVGRAAAVPPLARLLPGALIRRLRGAAPNS